MGRNNSALARYVTGDTGTFGARSWSVARATGGFILSLAGALALPAHATVTTGSYNVALDFKSSNAGIGVPGSVSATANFAKTISASGAAGGYQNFSTPKSCTRLFGHRVCTPSVNLGTFGASASASVNGGISLSATAGFNAGAASADLLAASVIDYELNTAAKGTSALNFYVNSVAPTFTLAPTSTFGSVSAKIDVDAILSAQAQAGGGRNTLFSIAPSVHTGVLNLVTATGNLNGTASISSLGATASIAVPQGLNGLQPINIPGVPPVNPPVSLNAALILPTQSGGTGGLLIGGSPPNLFDSILASYQQPLTPFLQVQGSITNTLASASGDLAILSAGIGGPGYNVSYALDQVILSETASLGRNVQVQGGLTSTIYFSQPINLLTLNGRGPSNILHQKFPTNIRSITLTAGDSITFAWTNTAGTIIGRKYNVTHPVFTDEAYLQADTAVLLQDLTASINLLGFKVPVINQTIPGLSWNACGGCTTLPVTSQVLQLYAVSGAATVNTISYGNVSAAVRSAVAVDEPGVLAGLATGLGLLAALRRGRKAG